jgi:hypothetical protein
MRASFCFAEVMLTARFQENERPGMPSLFPAMRTHAGVPPFPFCRSLMMRSTTPISALSLSSV